MDVCALIMRLLESNGQVKAAEVVKATGFSRTFINRAFQKLRDDGKIVLLGKANKAHYVAAAETSLKRAKQELNFARRIVKNENLLEDIVLRDIKNTSGIFLNIPKNIASILDYAFTEMLNNAIEHSQSAKIEIIMEKTSHNISFKVIDKGIGIFNNIMQKKGLNNTLESIQDLLKGKQTTDPQAHSGEGIFFTSKIADLLIIQSSRKKLIFNNVLKDIFIKDTKNFPGTRVSFAISCDSVKRLDDLFKQYTDETFSFSKTEVKVKLYKTEVEYVSRSQARRILNGIDKFKKIILDFADVETVGQGFADEIFRVWMSKNSEVEIEVCNANENIQLMINRAQAGAKK